MIRKQQIRRKSTKYISLIVSKDVDDKPKGNIYLQIIAALAGLVGILGALLWILGRFYYLGLFDSISIPSLQASLANEDYLEMGAISFISFVLNSLMLVIFFVLGIFIWKSAENFFTKMNITSSLVWFSIIISLLSFYFGVFQFFPSVNSLIIDSSFVIGAKSSFISLFCISLGLEAMRYSLSETQVKIVDSLRIFFVVMFGAIAFTTSLFQAYRGGYTYGCQITLNKLATLVVYSETAGVAQNQDVYTNKDNFLLFVDRNNYYVSNSTNPNTLKPDSTFIISKNSSGIAKISSTNTQNIDEELKNKASCDGIVIKNLSEMLKQYAQPIKTNIAVTPVSSPTP